MDISSVSIKIFDTHENDLELLEEYAERGAIQFKYHGASDRFSTVVASELSFNMMVNDMSDAKFLHLFTGSETRYRVELQDTSIVETPVTLWTGFLLPEQFSEPWTNNVFFVQFIATDGLGRIKQTLLPITFYDEKTAISVVLATCLKQTGLEFPIYIAPAIVNAVVDVKYSQIAVNTAAYDTGKKQMNPYEIIDSILISIGCKLFQWQEVWYVIGINRFADTTIVFEEYDADGVYVQQTIVDRLENTVVFAEHPTVSVQSPFKRVVVEWDKGQDEDLMPSDITYQPAEITKDWTGVDLLKYWVTSSEDFNVGLTSYDFANMVLFGQGSYSYAPTVDPLPTENPFYISIYKSTVSDNESTNYISLEKPFYVEGVLGGSKYASLSIECRIIDPAGLGTLFDGGFLDDTIKYDLILNGEIIVSNKNTFLNNEGFQFKLSMDEDIDYRVDAKLDVKKIPILEEGFLDLRLSAPIDGVGSNTRVVFKEIKLTFNTEDETLTKVRDIDFTAQKEIDIFHGDDKMEITKHRYSFTDDVELPDIIITTGYSREIEILAAETTEITTGGYLEYHRHFWQLSEENYLAVETAPEDEILLFVEAEGKYYTVSEYFPTYNYRSWASFAVRLEDGRAGFYEYTDAETPDPVILSDLNAFWVMRQSDSKTIDDSKYFDERWRRYEHDEDIRFTEALARVHHDTVKEAAFKIRGTAEGFINPLEMILFTFINGKQFVIGNSAVSVDLSTTTLELIEATKNNVEDYVTE